jgi:hypothetical protein
MSSYEQSPNLALDQFSQSIRSVAAQLSSVGSGTQAGPQANSVLAQAASFADIEDYQARNPDAQAYDISKAQVKAAMEVPITREGSTAADLFRARGHPLTASKMGLLHSAREIGILPALVQIAASFRGPGTEHPFKGLQSKLNRSAQFEKAKRHSDSKAEGIALVIDTETALSKHQRRQVENPLEQMHLHARRQIAETSREAAALVRQLPLPRLDNGEEVHVNDTSSDLVSPKQQYVHSLVLQHPSTQFGAVRTSSKAGTTSSAARPKTSKKGSKGALSNLCSRADAFMSIAQDRLRVAPKRQWDRPGSTRRAKHDWQAAPDTAKGSFPITEAAHVSAAQRLRAHKRANMPGETQLNVAKNAEGQAAGTKTLTPRSQSVAYRLFSTTR